MGAIPQYQGGLGYNEERIHKIEGGDKMLMVKDLVKDLEGGNRVMEVIKEKSRIPKQMPAPSIFSPFATATTAMAWDNSTLQQIRLEQQMQRAEQQMQQMTATPMFYSNGLSFGNQFSTAFTSTST